MSFLARSDRDDFYEFWLSIGDEWHDLCYGTRRYESISSSQRRDRHLALEEESGSLLRITIEAGALLALHDFPRDAQQQFEQHLRDSGIDDPFPIPDECLWNSLVADMRFTQAATIRDHNHWACIWIAECVQHGTARLLCKEIVVPQGLDPFRAGVALERNPVEFVELERQKPASEKHAEWFRRNKSGESYQSIAINDQVKETTVAKAIQRFRQRGGHQ